MANSDNFIFWKTHELYDVKIASLIPTSPKSPKNFFGSFWGGWGEGRIYVAQAVLELKILLTSASLVLRLLIWASHHI